ncbi:hypothetical protein SDC9_76972 [bioreactor metagenome]|uniref:Uncharacterized protein n=1 Tax=bioreactor metagenome TaxID=1076179 RepID=A0A644YP67_9ZZZZ
MVGEGNKIHVVAHGNARQIIKPVLQRARAVGVLGGMRVQLAVIGGERRLAHVEAPAFLRAYAVGPQDGYRRGVLSVFQGVGRVGVDRGLPTLQTHGLVGHKVGRALFKGQSHTGGGALVFQRHRNFRSFLPVGGAVAGGGHGGNLRLVENGYGDLRGGGGQAGYVGCGDGEPELSLGAYKLPAGNGILIGPGFRVFGHGLIGFGHGADGIGQCDRIDALVVLGVHRDFIVLARLGAQEALGQGKHGRLNVVDHVVDIEAVGLGGAGVELNGGVVARHHGVQVHNVALGHLCGVACGLVNINAAGSVADRG